MTDTDPSAYLDSLPEEYREPMRQLDGMIAEIFEGQPRTLWEGTFWGGSEQNIIGYGVLKTGRDQKTEWFMVGLAQQKNYISVYVNAVSGDHYVAELYRSRLGKVKVGKASISFRRIEDVDLDVLAEVLRTAREQL